MNRGRGFWRRSSASETIRVILSEEIMSKTKKFGIFIILAIFLSVVLLLIFFPSKGTTSASGVKTYGVDEYLEWMGKEQLSELFYNMDDENNTAYVLHHSAESDTDYRTMNTYAVYIPNAGGVSASGLVTAGPVFGRHLRLTLEANGQAGNGIFGLTIHSDKNMDFRVYLGGKRVNTEIKEVDFNPLPSAKQ